MQKPNWISANVNIPTIIMLFGLLVSGISFYNQTNYRLDEAEQYRNERSRQTDQKFADIQTQLLQFGSQNIPYRVTVIEQQLAVTNQRLDKSYEQINAVLDLLRRDVNGISTRVEVLGSNVAALTQKLDALGERKTGLYDDHDYGVAANPARSR